MQNFKTMAITGIFSLFLPLYCAGQFSVPAQLEVIPSLDGSALLRVEPGAWSSLTPELNRHAKATVLKRNPETGDYLVSSKFDFRNWEYPAKALVADDAEFIVTVDEWGSEIGVGPNVIVVYDSKGTVLKSWALEDIFSAEEIQHFGFPEYVNSRTRPWRGNRIWIRDDVKTGPIVYIEAVDPKKTKGFPFLRLFLRTMTIRK
jgi:hypothetical protein